MRRVATNAVSFAMPVQRPPGSQRTTSRLDDVDDEASASASSIEFVVSEDIGRTIRGRYRITDVIGEGGMGVVYASHDVQMDRKVAIKLVRSECAGDRKFLHRFRREMEVTSQLRHPSTVRVFEHGETEDGRPYMVMELLTGISLAERLEQGPLKEMEALQLARQVAESLSEAHQHGVFHRDLKPDNIFIETVGMTTVVKVLDFGIAGGVDSSRLTQAGEVFGTPQYMSPEQCNGLPLDRRTDIYSLGCILYEMLEGRPPFSAETPMATMLKHVRAKATSPRNCGSATVKLLMAALRKDRTKRIQSAAHFAEMIGECMGSLRDNRDQRQPNDAANLAPVVEGGGPSMFTPAHGLAPVQRWSLFSFRNPQHGRAVGIGLGVAALAIVGALMFVDPGVPHNNASEEKTESGSKHVSSSIVSDAKASPKNRSLVTSNVKGAMVLIDGVEWCNTPCEIEVPVGDATTHEIRLVKPGYTDVVANWQPRSVTEPVPALPDMKSLRTPVRVRR